MPAAQEPLPDIRHGRNFEVQIPGLNLKIGYFTQITGFSAQLDVLEYPEGGVNDYVHRLPTRIKQGNITLKRGVTGERALMRLVHGDGRQGQPAGPLRDDVRLARHADEAHVGVPQRLPDQVDELGPQRERHGVPHRVARDRPLRHEGASRCRPPRCHPRRLRPRVSEDRSRDDDRRATSTRPSTRSPRPTPGTRKRSPGSRRPSSSSAAASRARWSSACCSTRRSRRTR